MHDPILQNSADMHEIVLVHQGIFPNYKNINGTLFPKLDWMPEKELQEGVQVAEGILHCDDQLVVQPSNTLQILPRPIHAYTAMWGSSWILQKESSPLRQA